MAPTPPRRRDLSSRAVAFIVISAVVAGFATLIGAAVYERNLSTSTRAGYEACEQAAEEKLGSPARFSDFSYYQGASREEIRGNVAVTNSRGAPVWAEVVCTVEKNDNGWTILSVYIDSP